MWRPLLFLIYLSSLTYAVAQDSTGFLSEEEIRKLVPTSIEGFNTMLATEFEPPGEKYSMLKRHFENGDQSVIIYVFDYINNAAAIEQDLNRLRNMLLEEEGSESMILKKHRNTFSDGYEAHFISEKLTDISLVINNRFYFNLMATNLLPDEVSKILAVITFDKFPN
jgi:hypothetical protein